MPTPLHLNKPLLILKNIMGVWVILKGGGMGIYSEWGGEEEGGDLPPHAMVILHIK